MATEAQLLQTATSFIDAFENLNAEKHVSLRASNCKHLFAPASLNPPPPKTNEAFAAHLINLRKVLNHFPVTAKPGEIHVNPTKRQVVVWATAVPEFKDEVKGGIENKEWEYQGEYVFMLDMDEEGKITRIMEFLDSKATTRLLGLMEKARENLARYSGEEGAGLGFGVN
ncbi:hypothetical protein BDV96DRAFT_603227 [Lophiotrema nucula]|uniref:SnoaL-like domain-containing protein n=1 Tax=Lophiotrema nucula TaxID=690887 RepID=A0A6A5YYB7_9PLEO|nr:hypothetical protein BDV96DRAFT_603227 [Lophiotrema nucula]